MVAINPALDLAQPSTGPRGRALPSHGYGWASAVWASGLRPSVRLVALAVVHCASKGNRRRPTFYGFLSTLQEMTGLGRRTVERAVRHLVRVGFLTPDKEGPPHGRRAGCAARYTVAVYALAPRPKRAPRGVGGVRHGGAPRYVTVAHKAEAEERSERSEAGSETERTPKVEAQGDSLLSPLSPPAGGPATEGTEGKKKPGPRWGPKALSGIAAAERGLQQGATLREGSHAVLRRNGIDPRQIERIAECWGPEEIADVEREMLKKRASGKPFTNYAGYFLSLLQREYSEGAARFEASRPRGGKRGDRKRRGEVLDLGKIDLGEGFRTPSVPAMRERTNGHGRTCTCETCFAVLTAGRGPE